MDKKFTVKAQKIGGQIVGNEAHFFATPLVVEPEDAITAKRGLLYSALEIGSGNTFDPTLVLKVALDTLQTEYFNNPEGTPLSCLEKSIITLRDRVFNLLQDPKTMSTGSIEFHMVSCVLWGSVLYVVQYGNGCSYLVREGKVKPINTSAEGNFSVASGIVKDGDIVVLGSKGFCEKYPPETLTAMKPDESVDSNIAAVLVKFNMEENNLPSDFLDIKDEKVVVQKEKKKLSRKAVLAILAAILGTLLIVSVSSALKKVKVSNSSNLLAETVKESQDKLAEATSFIGKDNAKAVSLLEENLSLIAEAKDKTGSDSSSELDRILANINAKLDEVRKVTRVSNDVFYDLRVDNKDANPSELAATSKSLLVLEKDANTIRKITYLDLPKTFNLESTQAILPKFLVPTDSGASFIGSGLSYMYDSGNDKIQRSSVFPALKTAVAFYSYNGNIYYVSDGKVYKNNSIWSDDGVFGNVTSIAIDGSIYFLTSDSKILKYTSGQKNDFTIVGLDKALANPLEIVTTTDSTNLYILDKGNSRVVVLGKNGVFAKQFVLDSNWDDLRGITVSPDEKLLFVLSGTKIYKIAL